MTIPKSGKHRWQDYHTARQRPVWAGSENTQWHSKRCAGWRRGSMWLCLSILGVYNYLMPRPVKMTMAVLNEAATCLHHIN